MVAGSLGHVIAGKAQEAEDATRQGQRLKAVIVL